jgi:amino acid transporter
LGILSSIPAIFLAFDGFYATAGIQSLMKEPKRVATSMSVGIAIVSAIDISITLALILTTYSGTHGATGTMADLKLPKVLIEIFQICIAIGILGIINGFAIYSSRYYTDLVLNNEIPFAKKLKKYTKENSV